MENFLYFYTTGNGVHTFGTHRSSYNMGMISANYGKFFVLLYYGERCTHIWYTPFLLQYLYDCCQLCKIFCTSIIRGTVYTHLVHTVPLTILVWFLPIMENFLYFYTTGNGVHTFGTYRSSYNMGMISANYAKIFCTSILRGTVYTHLVHTVPLTIWVWFLPIMQKFFVLLYYGKRCTHIWYTPFLLQYGYDFGQLWKIFLLLYYGERCTHIWYTPFLLQYGYDFCQLWKIFCTSILRGTVYTHLVHTVPLIIWVWFRPIMENFLYFYTTGNGVHTFCTHRSSYNMGIISANYGNFLVLLYYGECCTHIWYTPFLLQFEYDFGQLWKIFCPFIARGTVYTHLVHTVPLTIWVWFRPIMENFLYFYTTGNGVHTFGTHRSSYNMCMISANYGKFFSFLLFSYGSDVDTFGTHRSSYNTNMISANYVKFFVLLYYGERCTHIWYTSFLLQYEYDFGQLWKIFCPSIVGGTVYTHLVHTAPFTIWV